MTVRCTDKCKTRGGVLLGCLTAVVGTLHASPARSEFEIQEATIESGSVEIEYRGAEHWGLSDPDFDSLRQSHELEIQAGVTDYWLLSVTQGFDQPLGEDLDPSAAEVETQFALYRREGDGIALAVRAGYEHSFRDGDPNQIGFGPIVEAADGPLLLTLDPVFTRQTGASADQRGLGFEYGWQLEYRLSDRLALALEAFGEIDDLADPGSFDEQNHSIGPTLYAAFDDEGTRQITVGLGVQLGLNEATSDAALKLDAQFEF